MVDDQALIDKFMSLDRKKSKITNTRITDEEIVNSYMIVILHCFTL
jgi:hypothetical protein